MGMARKLEGVCQGLTPLEKQGNIVGFMTNVENTQRINGLVEDIRDAVMEYQV